MLAAPEEGLVGQVLPAWRVRGGDDGPVVRRREPRVAVERVALPDLHRGVLHRRVAVGEADAELQRHALAVLDDVASKRL